MTHEEHYQQSGVWPRAMRNDISAAAEGDTGAAARVAAAIRAVFRPGSIQHRLLNQGRYAALGAWI